MNNIKINPIYILAIVAIIELIVTENAAYTILFCILYGIYKIIILFFEDP